MNEMPKCCRSIDRIARKQHRCFGCGCDIKKGESYRYTSGVWDEPESFKHCLSCAMVIDNFKLFDSSLDRDEGPSLERGGVSCWINDYVCDSWRADEAAIDLAKTFDLPQEYFLTMLEGNRILRVKA